MRPATSCLITLLLLAPPTPAGSGVPLTSDTIQPPRPDPSGWFGDAVALSGPTAAIGAPGEGSHGRVHLYGLTPESGWRHAATLAPPTGLDVARFGDALALSPDRLVVGAVGDRDHAGRVLVYERAPTGAWHHATTLRSGVSAPGDGFGATLALDSDRLAIGAPGTRQDTGRVELYALDADPPRRTAGLSPPALDRGAAFGDALALEGTLLAIGAPGRRVDGTDTGQVTLAHLDADGIASLTTLSPPSPRDRIAYGAALVLDATPGGRVELAVGAPEMALHGRVLAYTGPGIQRLELIQRVRPPGPDPVHGFGAALAREDTTLAVTAEGLPRGHQPPVVHRFEPAGLGRWQHTGTVADTQDAHSGLGQSLALTQGGALVGAPWAWHGDDRAGAASWHPLGDPDAGPPPVGVDGRFNDLATVLQRPDHAPSTTWPISS